MKDRLTGNPRGFGFVTFADETAAEEVTQMKHVLDGRQVMYCLMPFSDDNVRCWLTLSAHKRAEH